MKKKITLVLCFSTAIVLGQTVTPTVLASDGGYASTAQGSIAWTIGEPVVDTYVTAGNVTTMGFQQPEMELVTMISERQNASQVLIYPNPVKDEISINFSGMQSGVYTLELHDALGKLIYQGKANVGETSVHYSIKVNEVADGVYFLNVNSNDFMKTIKINKVN